jgi:hypothetical protein
MLSSDYQETKNIDTASPSIMPNTRTATATVRVVDGVTVDWLLGRCTRLEVAAGSNRRVRLVRFAVAGRALATVHRRSNGIWSARVHLPRGTHVVLATALDAGGRAATARRIVRSCSG